MAKSKPTKTRVVAEVFPPADFIREEMEARGWDVDTLAKCSWLRSEGLREILAGSRRVTPVYAFGLAQAFGTGKDLWLNLQATWDRRRGNTR